MPIRKTPSLSKLIIRFELPVPSFSYPPCTSPGEGTPARTPDLAMSQTPSSEASRISFMIITPHAEYSTQFPGLYPAEYPTEIVINESSESDDESVEDLTRLANEKEDGQGWRWGEKGQEPLGRNAVCPGAPKLSPIDLPKECT
ncbi:hypothetical protein C366_06333 [Cryptococcus neoformans Tu401-1]|nr:hypothetical protein C365_05050 [Cryptococcus neoformans var. grubii Bt85]OXG11294.1 hypothetical protein C366_06333 [Cryptococcus neoformans var. grubii Tu401-1]OXM76206.1 hypothetical protein C364_06310 [Cryptococcus neoformans var. grubii Bt63]